MSGVKLFEEIRRERREGTSIHWLVDRHGVHGIRYARQSRMRCHRHVKLRCVRGTTRSVGGWEIDGTSEMSGVAEIWGR